MRMQSETARAGAPVRSAARVRSGSSGRRLPAVALTLIVGAILGLGSAAACSPDPETTPAGDGPSPTPAVSTSAVSPSPATGGVPAEPSNAALSTGAAAPTIVSTDTAPATGGVPPASGASPPPADTGGRHAATVDGAVLEGGAIGGIYSLTDVRVGRHDGFTRIVWEMEEASGEPYHRIVTRVRPEGAAGEPFGRHWLEISVSDVYAWSRPELLQAREVDEPGAVTAVRSLMIGDDAIYAVGVALTGPARFDVTLLEAPVRLVLDVFDEG